jgi:hypothetical protein
MRTLRLAVVVCFGLIAISCATPVRVKYKSDPPGAMITYEDGSGMLGITPVRNSYPSDELNVSENCFSMRGVRATWISGAQAVSDDPLVFCGRSGGDFEITFQRPFSYPGSDLDTATFIEFESIREDQGQEQELHMYRIMQLARLGKTDIDLNVRCRSQQTGNKILTTCDQQ